EAASEGTATGIRPKATPTLARWYRSREVASPHTGMRQPTRTSWSWPRLAMSRSVGRAGPVFVTTARAVWFRARLPMDRSHSISPPTATSLFAAHSRRVTSSSICESRGDEVMNTTSTAVEKFSVEVITLPVSDVDRALRFYVDRVGFTLDVDYAP